MKLAKATPPLSRREREHAARQEDIMKAARELFARQGYHDTTLEDIARHAEFGKGTIYNYFSSKEDLFYGIIDRLTSDVLAMAESSIAGTQGDARDKLTSYARAMITFTRANSDLVQLIMRELYHLESEEYDARLKKLSTRTMQVREILARPIAREVSAKHVKSFDAFTLATLFDGMLHFFCMSELKGYHHHAASSVDETAASLVSVFYDGIAERKLKG